MQQTFIAEKDWTESGPFTPPLTDLILGVIYRYSDKQVGKNQL